MLIQGAAGVQQPQLGGDWVWSQVQTEGPVNGGDRDRSPLPAWINQVQELPCRKRSACRLWHVHALWKAKGWDEQKRLPPPHKSEHDIMETYSCLKSQIHIVHVAVKRVLLTGIRGSKGNHYTKQSVYFAAWPEMRPASVDDTLGHPAVSKLVSS